MAMSPFRWINTHHTWFRAGIFCISLAPAAYLFSRLLTDNLGFNPFETLIATTGITALVFLCLTLAITPSRRWLSFAAIQLRLSYGKRLSDWNFLIRSRRMLGLYCFFYACLHAGVYVYYEMDFAWSEIVIDIRERNFLSVGLLAWLVAFVLAITSPSVVQRNMGIYWRKLHRGMYLLSVLAILHLYLEAKLLSAREWWFSAVIAILLGHRLLVMLVRQWRRQNDDGLVSQR